MIMKCGNCGAEYELQDWIRLKKVPRNPTDVSPAIQSGYTYQCKCGYIFGVDRWKLRETVTIPTPIGDISVTVNTSFLEVGFEDGKGTTLWFETVIIPDTPSVECYTCWRYRTKEDAQAGHERVVRLLKEGKFVINPVRWELELKAD